jgi:hypothetical protein
MDRTQQKLSGYRDISGSTVLAAGDNLSATARTLQALVTGYSIFIQRILVDVITDNAATLTFGDTASSPIVIAGTKVSPGIGPILFDFGPDGRQLTESQAFVLKNSAAGLAADITWQGYLKPIGVLNPIIGNTVGGGTPGTLHS